MCLYYSYFSFTTYYIVTFSSVKFILVSILLHLICSFNPHLWLMVSALYFRTNTILPLHIQTTLNYYTYKQFINISPYDLIYCTRSRSYFFARTLVIKLFVAQIRCVKTPLLGSSQLFYILHSIFRESFQWQRFWVFLPNTWIFPNVLLTNRWRTQTRNNIILNLYWYIHF